MELYGRVDHGVIVPQGQPPLPEGAMVRIVYEPESGDAKGKRTRHVRFPLVRTGTTKTLHLTNKMIAEILDEEDFSDANSSAVHSSLERCLSSGFCLLQRV